jgi:Trypsin-like peptidase domain
VNFFEGEPMALDRLSLSTVPITPFFNDFQLPEATGFVWKRRDRFYLITNWHVAAATNIFTKRLLLKTGARPNSFRCTFIIRVGGFERETVDIPIRDANDEPVWLVYAAQNIRAIDIVAIPLDPDAFRGKVTLLPVNELAPGRIAIMIGMDVFILGYPFGSGPPTFPVWKRGSIASEPDLVKMTTGYYLIDTASRPGMSGSPVILRSWKGHLMESGNFTAMTDGPIDRVIGIYSGRKEDVPGEAQIGMVWHVDYIDYFIDGNNRDV